MEALTGPQFDKVLWVLGVVQDMQVVPSQYFQKLSGTSGLWEVRIQHGGNEFRLLGFFDGLSAVVLVSAFSKKTQKTPPHEIELAETRKRDYLSRKED